MGAGMVVQVWRYLHPDFSCEGSVAEDNPLLPAGSLISNAVFAGILSNYKLVTVCLPLFCI